MSEQPTARDMIELPGPFRFKVIVRPDCITESALLGLTRETLGRDAGEIKVSTNPSKGGKYLGYTLEVHILKYEEIEALYQAYQNHPASAFVV